MDERRIAPVIFDGRGRLYLQDGRVILDEEGVQFASGELFKISRSDFELIKEVGAGQYGTVWSVRHRPSGTPMALKVVKLSVTDTAIKQILTELDILVRSKSPFIVDCYGAFYSEASVYFCMEFMDRGSLSEISSRKNPTEDVIRAVAFSVIGGLIFLREAFCAIHRDIKPTNILISSDGNVKICDFGVSGYLARSLARTRVGTSNYMAPERICLGGDELGGGGYGSKADVWSLGATLMELTTGQPPFPMSNYDCIFAQLMEIIHTDAPKIPRKVYSDALADFIDSCLLKDPNRRPGYADLLRHPFISGMTINQCREIIINWLE